MSMTRKDYELLASAIKAEVAHIQWDCNDPERIYLSPEALEVAMSAVSGVVDRLVDKLVDDNPRFSASQFIKACGL